MVDAATEVCSEGKGGPPGQLCLGHAEVGKRLPEEMALELSLARRVQGVPHK